MSKDKEVVINVSSTFGAVKHQPLVKLSIDKHEVLMPAAKAQEIGMKMIHGAEAAMMDSFFFQYLRNQLDVPEERVAFIIRDYRQFREEHRFEMRYLIDEQGEPKPEV
jgi:hypothetical protein